MKRVEHLLPQSSIGNQRSLASVHFGETGSGRKVYVQAGLHADEPPGYLVALRLLKMLERAEQNNEITGEIIVVPVANPIGLAQWNTDTVQGRFDRFNNVNFNRNHLDLIEEVAEKLKGKLSSNGAENTTIIRKAISSAISEIIVQEESEYLKHLLYSLSHDADIVLDLHCDCQAVMHIYTGTDLWPDARDLSAQMGAQATLLADDSGGCPFDEANSKIWWQLAARFPDYPIAPSCLAATVELRGSADTHPEQTEQDAINIYTFLQRRGFLAGKPSPLPELKDEATPLEGVEYIKADKAGILSYLKEPGELVKNGDIIAHLIDPLGEPGPASTTLITASTDGLLFARSCDRFARPGKIVAKVAGKEKLTGKGNQLLTI